MPYSELSQHIEQRIDEATPGQSKYNFWPTEMDIISTTVYDLSKANEAYLAGQLIGRENYAFRQIFPEKVPFKLPPNHWILSTQFMLAGARGQGDDHKTRNLLAVFEASPTATNNFNKIVVAIEIGCKHDYEIRAPYNCYREGKCKKCGHTWSCDSSG